MAGEQGEGVMQMPDVRPKKPGRINCGGLLTRGRTFDAEKNQGYSWIICGRCWRLLPSELRQQHKRLNAMHRKMERAKLRAPDRAIAIDRALEKIAGLHGQNSAAIAEFFRAPSKPLGLDTFLEEVGL